MLLVVAVLFCFAGCNTKSGDGMVVGKEYVAAANDKSTPTERTLDHEQWIVKVEMVTDLRRVDVHVDQPQFDRIKKGDRLHVTYHQGKYTGTIWGAEIN